MGNPVVAIVGRPNVGKSTLFNRLVGKKLAVVHGEPGVTRDRKISAAAWGGRSFWLVDTGGFVPEAKGGMEALVREQASLAVEEANVVLLVVDGVEGLNPLDVEIAQILRERGKPTVLVVNKIDNAEREALVHEFHVLGLGEPVAVSAVHGRSSDDVLDKVVAALGETQAVEEPANAVSVAVVGKPNVGKSSIINRLLHEERMIVHESPGTTRDSVDSFFRYDGREFILIDTAGMRRKRSISDALEVYSVVRALKSIERSSVVFLVLDASAGLTSQDTRIAAIAHRSGKPSVVVFNKWDLVEKDYRTAVDIEKEFHRRLPFLSYAPVVFASALTGLRIARLPALALEVVSQSRRKLTDQELLKALKSALAKRRPPTGRSGKAIVLKRASQSSVAPPTFTLFVTERSAFRKAYILYLINSLRGEFGFRGTPVRLKVRTALSK
jgi:GTP-binding protein